MFGFVPGPCGCFSSDDRSSYLAHFCGLCNVLRKQYGLWSRFLINRDTTFIALLGSAISPQEPAVAPATCCNPLGKKKPLLAESPHLRYAAAVTVCGLGAKLEDDGEDESGWKGGLARGARFILDHPVETAKIELYRSGFPVDEVAAEMSGQRRVEDRGADLWSAAGPTRRAFGQIMGHLPAVTGAGEEQSAPLRSIGENLGVMIYAADAWKDYASDRKRGRFNALPEGEEDRRGMVKDLFTECLHGLQKAFHDLRLCRLQDLTSALILQGLPARASKTIALPSEGGEGGPPALPGGPAGKGGRRSQRFCGSWCDIACCDAECCECCDGCSGCADCGECCSGCDSCS